MSKGLPFRARFIVAMAVAILVSVTVAPLAWAQSPDDIPGFDQLPLPGGDDPADDGDGGGDSGTGDTDDDGVQVDAPGGGVDTGAGGMAGDSAPLTLAAAAAVASMGGAVVAARRRERA